MGQYYQPPAPQYAPPPTERQPRTHRRDRRTKRAASPPAPQQYYLQYPQYYPAQAQGAPLYHLPVYQPFVYGPYAYPSYYPEYPMPVEGEAEKGPEEYPPEVVMEQEAVDAYYASAPYGGPPYGPPVDGTVEYVPPMYLQPPPHPPAVPMQQPPPHHTPHQFNVHAKNFVQGQSHTKTFIPQDKGQESRTPPATASASAASSTVETLAIKDLKITAKGPGSPKQNDRLVEGLQPKPPVSGDKASNAPKSDTTKPTWISGENKTEMATANAPSAKGFIPSMATSNQVTNKSQPNISKPPKGPTAPFSSGKQQAPKSTMAQTVVPVQQAVSTPKAPFGNRQKRDGITNRSPSGENAEGTEKNAQAVEHVKREPPLPPSKAPMPISITLHSAGPPLIVTNKSPFAHSRKALAAPEPPPAPQPPPPAPTASDFPPPPTPRNRGEQIPPPVVQPQPQPAPGKSWASLFSNKPTPASTVSAAPVSEDPPSPTTTTPPAAPNVQKPVAKVPPFDASPLTGASVDKSVVPPRVQASAAPAISYSEKTSVNAVSGAPTVIPPAKPVIVNAATLEPREVPIQKESLPAQPIQPSPFSDDPNSYRMGGKKFFKVYSL